MTRKRCLSYYRDIWDFSSDLEIRAEHYGHQVSPYKIIGHSSVIPELIRNGFDGKFHDCNPYDLFYNLLTNNQIETLWKMRQFKLVKSYLKSPYTFNHHWPSIRIALRHGYTVSDPTLWYDMLDAMAYFNKDIRNPQLICPNNLAEAHDYWVVKKAAHEERLRVAREREREIKYLTNPKQVQKDEDIYRQTKSKFFDLIFQDKELVIKPLTSIKEFIDEWHALHHCVFTNRYFAKPTSLILHAIVNGKSVATIELNIENLQIIQCRGAYNTIPALKDRIIALIESNKGKIAQKIAA